MSEESFGGPARAAALLDRAAHPAAPAPQARPAEDVRGHRSQDDHGRHHRVDERHGASRHHEPVLHGYVPQHTQPAHHTSAPQHEAPTPVWTRHSSPAGTRPAWSHQDGRHASPSREHQQRTGDQHRVNDQHRSEQGRD